MINLGLIKKFKDILYREMYYHNSAYEKVREGKVIIAIYTWVVLEKFKCLFPYFQT